MPESRRRRSNRPHPPVGIQKAASVAQAITDNNAGHPMSRILLAEAMGRSPSSSGFRNRIAAAARYGLCKGNYNSEQISLSQLGVAVTRPRNDEERITGLRGAFQRVPIFKKLLDHFANNALPKAEFLENILARDPFNIDPAWSAATAEAFAKDARQVGFLREISGKSYIVLDGSTTAPEPVPATGDRPSSVADATGEMPSDDTTGVDQEGDSEQMSDIVSGDDDRDRRSDDRPHPMQIFIAHGRNRKPLEQLKGILNAWKVPFLVAVEEPNAGRPISTKVAETMRDCSAGIFIFTADEEFKDEMGAPVKRPNENVIFELGAASLLYGRKIVILKESGVAFPSDFSDLGWIEFEQDNVEAKAMDLLRELIALNALRLVSPTSE